MRAHRCSLLVLLPSLVSVCFSIAIDGDTSRTKRQASLPCAPKYAALTPTNTMCLVDSPKAVAIALNQSTKDIIVQKHNDIRASVNPHATNMVKMVWDDTLAQGAQKWAMQCKEEHDTRLGRRQPDWPGVFVNQNLGVGHMSFSSLIKSFYDEKYSMNYSLGQGYVLGAGHYFQVIANQAGRVGCGHAECPFPLRICNYAPGLDAGQLAYKNGTSCGDCPKYCSGGKLCDCKGKLCYNSGSLNLSTCNCDCPERKTGENCELVNCKEKDLYIQCVNGDYTKEDCGKNGTRIEDPTLCMHLCGLCPKTCGDLECKNGGTLDETNCICKCKGRLEGKQCDDCPEMDKNPYCRSLPKTSCDNLPRSPGSLSLHADLCPIYCGICKKPVNCNKTCENYGFLNTTSCECQCGGTFKGDTCQTCPAKDTLPQCPSLHSYCEKEPWMFSTIQLRCPYICGVCHH